MGLQESTISLNLDGSLNLAEDSKVADQKTFSVIQDFVRNKRMRLDKRPGSIALPTTVQNDFVRPLGIGASTSPSGIYSHKNQLILQNRGALYSYSQNSQVWNFVGHHMPIEAKAETIVSNEGFVVSQNVGVVGNLTIYAYFCYLYDSSVTTNYHLRYTVVDETSGAKIAYDQEIATVNGLINMKPPQVVTFQNACFIVWQNGTLLLSSAINLTTGSAGTPVSFASDAYNGGSTNLSNLSPYVACPDWTYGNIPGIGERAFICYWAQTPLSNVKIIALKNDGTVDAAMGNAQAAISGGMAGASIFYSTVTGSLYLAFTNLTTSAYGPYNLSFFTCTVTSTSISIASSLVNQYAGATDSSALAHSSTICDDPTNAGSILVFFDPIYLNFMSPGISGVSTNLATVFMYRYSGAGSMLTYTQVVGRGLLISGKALVHASRKTVYLPTEYNSVLQGTALLLDIFQGKSEAAAFTLAKLLPGEVVTYTNFTGGQPTGSQQIPLHGGTAASFFLSNGTLVYTCLVKAVAAGPSYSTNPVTTYTTGVAKISVNLRPLTASSSAYLNNGTHLAGGYLGYFDGSRVVEHNFMLPPDQVEGLSQATGDRVVFTTIQGASGVAGYFIASFYGGASVLNGPINYWTFNVPGGAVTNFVVYYIVDGIGSAPSVSGAANISVSVASSDTAGVIATKTALALNQNPFVQGLATVPDGTLHVNYPTGVTFTAPSAANFTSSTSGLPAGTYFACAVYNWVDANGQVFRSAPSNPVKITSTGFPCYLNLVIPPVTNRSCADVGIEIYRTILGGTTLYKLTDLPLTLRLDPTKQTASYLLGGTDTTVAGAEQLYTTGGVQPNYGLPAVKSVSTFKGRLIASGGDNTTVYYSKTSLPASSVDCVEAQFIALQDDGQAINGHAQLDDKLVIFKDQAIYYLAGDGANDLGVGSTFSDPFLIPSDVGGKSQKSIEVVPEGIWFSSSMGLSLLNRSGSVEFRGEGVEDFSGNNIVRATVLKTDLQVRQIRFAFSDTATMLVYDYLSKEWSTFSNRQATDACLWGGAHSLVNTNGQVIVESKSLWTDAGSSYNPVFQTQWLKLKNVQDFSRIWRLIILGELKSAHVLNVNVFYDYDLTNSDAYSFSSSNIAGLNPGDGVYQCEIHLKRQKCEAIMVQVTAVSTTGTQQALTLTDISFLVGVKRGFAKLKAAKTL